MSNYSFDKVSHIYRDNENGRQFASVTQVLKKVGLYTGGPWFNDPLHRQRGEAVHQACQIIDSGRYDHAPTSVEIQPYALQYQKFVQDTGFKGKVWEVGMVSTRDYYAGRFDVIGVIPNGDIWLCDIKSGSVPHHVGVQLAAYESLLGHGEIIEDPTLDINARAWIDFARTQKSPIKRRSLNLKLKGPYTLRAHDEPHCAALWRAALLIHHAQEKA